MNFISIIILLSIGQGVFLGILLLDLNRGNKTANRLLGILMLLFSFSISGFLFTHTNTYKDIPWIIGVPSTVLFLFGPLFYFYVQELITKNFRFKKKDLAHLIPFFLLVLYRIPFFFENTEDKLASIKYGFQLNDSLIILSLQIIHLFIYLFFTKRLLKENAIKLKSRFSSLEELNLRWINSGIKAFLITFGLVAGFTISFFFGPNFYSHFNVIIPLLVSVIILSIGYLGLSRPIIFVPEYENNKGKKYEKSTLTEKQAEKYSQDLLNVMQQKKPYLKNDLTLQDLADLLSIPSYHLSQIINDRMEQNFFDFINCYRIEEAKILLQDPRSELLTILAIAEEVGFNSKSSFNNAFKKCTLMTPTQYKNSLLSPQKPE